MDVCAIWISIFEEALIMNMNKINIKLKYINISIKFSSLLMLANYRLPVSFSKV